MKKIRITIKKIASTTLYFHFNKYADPGIQP